MEHRRRRRMELPGEESAHQATASLEAETQATQEMAEQDVAQQPIRRRRRLPDRPALPESVEPALLEREMDAQARREAKCSAEAVADALVRRRRRVQTRQEDATTGATCAGQAPAPAHTIKPLTWNEPSSHNQQERIPRLPKEDVHTAQDEKRAARTLRQPKAAQQGRTAAERPRWTNGNRAERRVVHNKKREANAEKTLWAAVCGGAKALGQLAAACVGSLVLLGAQMGGKGAKALRTLLERAKERPSRVSEDGHAPQPESAVVLQAIRPEDYHGRAQQRSAVIRQHDVPKAQGDRIAAAKRYAGKTRAWRKPDLYQVLTLIFAGTMVVSACMIAGILWRTIRTKSTNEQLSQLYAQASEATAPPNMVVFAPEESVQPVRADAPALAYVDEATTDSDAAPDEPAPTPDAWAEPEETPDPAATPEATAIPMNKRVFQQVGGDALPQMAALYQQNRDIVGWLNIENVLDLPVMYRDNSYYLTHDFYKNKNTAGTLFLDVNHPFKEKTQNLLLHGHNMKDSTMFGRLVQYETDLNYVKWHPFVRFDTLWREEEYVIFAVLRVSLDPQSEAFFDYFTYPTFGSEYEFESYIRALKKASIYAIPIDVKPNDALLTLSTCLDEDRLVIVARRVRAGETHEGIRQNTYLSTRQ